ncbi:MAG: hypothetical protein JXP37_05110, partial [Coriobacteriia bacterium]|nr:hypothetical protein [Coriobacteriia bacterium]
MSARTRWFVAGAVLLLLVVGGVAVLTPGGGDTPVDGVEDTAVRDSGDDSPNAPEAGFPFESSGVSATTASLTGTTAAASTAVRRRAVSVEDTPAPAPTDEEKWQLYLEQTRAIVETDPAALQAMAEKILEALNAGDEGALAEYLP